MTRQDATDVVSTTLAAAAVVIQALLAIVLVVAVAAIWSQSARRLLSEARDSLLGSEIWIAWGFALVATAGSLFFSEYSQFIPCRLCWFQRIGMYPLAAILLIAAIRRDTRGGALYGLPLAIFGSIVSIYHIYIEHHPEAETASCKIGAPCTTKWIDKLGYITIPTLALTAFLAIIVLLSMALSRRSTRSLAT
ncbi:MAG TPA: disulfide oxidoreductase [Thermoleophilaceae bacterium]|nr:disulfide oxidoreductase [Thermoleophilaceae bacterium]